jgi:hypothetical protein
LRRLRLDAAEDRELLAVDFTDAALTTLNYDDYTRKIGGIESGRLEYRGLALYGPRKAVERLSGSLPLLR